MKGIKKILTVFFCLYFISISLAVKSQSNPPAPHIGLFAPLHLDSVFTGDDFKYNKSFPKFVVPGIDFVQGAEIAVDTLASESLSFRLKIFDSRSATESIREMIDAGKLNDLDMIIGSVKDNALVTLANFAKKKKIPFISATYPNDGGITDNPYLIILNSTLHSHCEAIFSWMLQNYGTEKIYLVRKAGEQEDKVADYLKMINEPDGWPLLKIETIKIDSNFNVLKEKLDSNKTSIIIGGSLDDEFAKSLASTLYSMQKKYTYKLIGMPNWNGFNFVKNGTYKDQVVYFTSTYFNEKKDNFSLKTQQYYLEKYKGLPSEFAYKGFETLYYFSKLLLTYRSEIMLHLNDGKIKPYSDFFFKPVLSGKSGRETNYYENKHLFILKAQNGTISKIN